MAWGGQEQACTATVTDVGRCTARGRTSSPHATVYNRYSNLWWWVRIDGTSSEGWIYADYLSGVDFDDNNDGHENIKYC
jgi:hypothetical protein